MAAESKAILEREQLLDELVTAYLRAVTAGHTPDRRELLARHPDLAAELEEFFADQDDVQRWATPLRMVAALQAEGTLGDFRILREIGRGGMGVVYEAMQISLGRRVALKVLPFAAALDSKQLQRFKNEAQAAAGLQHTNIVPVYFVGCERGVHFYAMQFVEGQTLAALIQELRQLERREASAKASGAATKSWAAELISGQTAQPREQAGDPKIAGSCPLPPFVPPYQPGVGLVPSPAAETITPPVGALSTERSTNRPAFFQTVAKLGIQAAEALEHAHSLGVIHRDIKPGNLMVDARGNLWIADFGLAHCQGGVELTMSGDLLGTLRYMSPEQALAKRIIVDHRTDIYSLGATLYELLTLEPAFNGKDRQEVLRQIAFEEPKPPRRLKRAIPAELETIVLKAMEKNPTERYATARELANDLERFLKHEPIQARRPTLWQRTKKWSRRHRPVVTTLAAAMAALLVLAAVGSVVAGLHIDAAWKDEREQRRLAEQEAEARRQLLVRLHETNGVRLMDEGDLLGSLLWFAEALKLDEQDTKRNEQDTKRQELHRLRLATVLQRCPKLVQAWFQPVSVRSVNFSPDGRRLVTTGRGPTGNAERVWDVSTGEPLTPPLSEDDCPNGLVHAAFSPDGRRIVTVNMHGTARVWDAVTGQAMSPPLKHDGYLQRAAFSPDGRYVVTASSEEAWIWDAATGNPVTDLYHYVDPIEGIVDVRFSADGRRVFTIGAEARLWDAATGQAIPLTLKDSKEEDAIAFSPDGRRVLTQSWDNMGVRAWDIATGLPLTPILQDSSPVLQAAFSLDGRRVLIMRSDETNLSPNGSMFSGVMSWEGIITARVWDVATARPLTPPLKHVTGSPSPFSPVTHPLFSPDFDRLLTIWDKKVQVWDVKTGQPLCPPLKHESDVNDATFSPDGRQVVTASGGTMRVWDITSPDRPLTPSLKHDAFVPHAAFSPDGRRVATACEDGTAQVWDAATGAAVTPPLSHDAYVLQAAFSRDGGRLLTVSMKINDEHEAIDQARVWDAATGRPITPPLKRCVRACFSPDGGAMLTVSEGSSASTEARVWDAATGRPITGPLKHHKGIAQIAHAAFSPDGRYVVTAGRVVSWVWVVEGVGVEDAQAWAQLWDATTGAPVAPPISSAFGAIEDAAFSPDSRLVATAGTAPMTRVWDVATGQPVTPPLGEATHAAFSPDGTRVLTLNERGGDAKAKIWDAATGVPVTSLEDNTGLLHAAFSPDGRRILTSSHSIARVWDAATGQPVSSPLKHPLVTGGSFVRGLSFNFPTPNMLPSFSPDSRYVVTRNGDSAFVWDAATGQPVSPPLRHNEALIQASFSPDGRRLVTTSWDRTARIWELVPDDRPVQDLLLLAQLLTGHKIDATGSLMAADSAILSKAWEALRFKYPASFRRLPQELEAWHWQEVEAGERTRRRSAASNIRMAGLLATDPDQKRRDPRRAVELAKQAVEEDPHGNHWWTLGVAHYRAGDWKETVAALEKKISVTDDPATLRHIRTELSSPTTIEFDPNTPLKESLAFIAARYGLTIRIDKEAFKAANIEDVEMKPIALGKLVDVSLGTILRATLSQVGGTYIIRRDYIEITTPERIQKSVRYTDPPFPDLCFLLAMAHWQAGQKEAARKWYDRGVPLIDKEEERSALQTEAEALLGIKKKKGQQPLPPSKGS